MYLPVLLSVAVMEDNRNNIGMYVTDYSIEHIAFPQNIHYQQQLQF